MSTQAPIQLFLLRHAHAGDALKWHGSDDDRPLSDRGRRQAERMGRFMAESGFAPDVILCSPKLRALETGRLVAAALGLPVVIAAELGGPLDVDAFEKLLSESGNPTRPLLVGHDPDFSDLAADLAGMSELPLRKGTLVRVDLHRPASSGRGTLRWLIPPEALGLGDRSD